MDTQKLIQSLNSQLGQYATFRLNDVSYYPRERAQERLRVAIYGLEHTTSHKWNEEYASGRSHVHFPSPFGHDKSAAGSFILFFPADGNLYGMMDMRSLHTRRPDVNLSIVPPTALAPNRLHIVGWNGDSTFYGVDEEGSNWSIHCTRD